MSSRKDVWQGTLALMVLKTLQALGPLHGYGLMRRIEQTSGDELQLNYGTLYPALVKLEQEGVIERQLGRVGERAARALLPPHARRQAAGGARRARLAPGHRDPRALFSAGQGTLVSARR